MLVGPFRADQLFFAKQKWLYFIKISCIMSQGSFKAKRTQTVVFVLFFWEFSRNVSRIVIEYFCNKMLVLNLSPRHYFANILLNISSKNKIKVCFMMSIERAVESTIKPFLYLIRKPRNNQKQSGNSIVGHPVQCNFFV